MSVAYIRSIPLISAAWWFIENVAWDDPDRNELFFALRERVREEAVKVCHAVEHAPRLAEALASVIEYASEEAASLTYCGRDEEDTGDYAKQAESDVANARAPRSFPTTPKRAKPMNTIQTTLTHYRFDLTKEKQREEYESLVKGPLSSIGFPVWRMRADFHDYSAREPVERFLDKVRALVGRKENTHGLTSGPVVLETKHLFDNQWNGESLRLFNWAEVVYNNRNIREGYYLTQTDEMREVLRNTHKCGFCGALEPAAKGYTFCPHCIDSQHLEADYLRLTRMVPVRDTSKPRSELSDAEREHLMPLFNAAQLYGATERGKARIAKERAAIAKKLKDAVAKAQEEHDAAVWIMDNVPAMLENWIFYAHTGRHCFGWRKKLNAAAKSAMLEVISEFPFAYTLLCADGDTLENYNG